MKKKNNELYHYGILGMKWGVRRYQNKDGSYTAEGRARYNKDPHRVLGTGNPIKTRVNDIIYGPNNTLAFYNTQRDKRIDDPSLLRGSSYGSNGYDPFAGIKLVQALKSAWTSKDGSFHQTKAKWDDDVEFQDILTVNTNDTPTVEQTAIMMGMMGNFDTFNNKFKDIGRDYLSVNGFDRNLYNCQTYIDFLPGKSKATITMSSEETGKIKYDYDFVKNKVSNFKIEYLEFY